MNIGQNERALVVQVRYGLSNRLWTMAKAYAWSRIFQRRLAVIWEPEEACGCLFPDLFDDGVEPIPAFKPAEEWFSCYDGLYREYGGPAAWPRAIKSHRIDPLHLLKNKNLFLKAFDLSLNLNHANWWLKPALSNRLYHRIFRQLQRNFLLKLKIKDDIAKRLADYDMRKLTGMHIRIGDIKAPMVDFPDFVDKFRGKGYERFIRVLDQFFEQQKKEKIFLACNDPEFQDKIAARYNSNIVFYVKRSLDRTSKIAIQDALIDLMLLSQTKRIIGTKYSSFSKLASLWGNVPVRLV
jgi:hypothetical protein